jgi:hypothetical protein
MSTGSGPSQSGSSFVVALRVVSDSEPVKHLAVRPQDDTCELVAPSPTKGILGRRAPCEPRASLRENGSDDHLETGIVDLVPQTNDDFGAILKDQ